MPNDQQGMKLPVPGKDFKPDKWEGGPMNPDFHTVTKYSDEAGSPARADRVVKGLES